MKYTGVQNSISGVSNIIQMCTPRCPTEGILIYSGKRTSPSSFSNLSKSLSSTFLYMSCLAYLSLTMSGPQGWHDDIRISSGMAWITHGLSIAPEIRAKQQPSPVRMEAALLLSPHLHIPVHTSPALPEPPDAIGELANSGTAIPLNCSREELPVGLANPVYALRAHHCENSPFE